MQDNQDSRQQEQQEEVVQKQFSSIVDKFKLMSPINKIAFVSGAFIMTCVIIFILFFTGNKSPQKKSNAAVKDVIEAPKIQAELSNNIYTQSYDSKDKLIDNIESNITSLKPPAPPVIIQEPFLKPPAPPVVVQAPIQQSKVQEPQLPVMTVKKTHETEENNAPKISSTSIMTFGGDGNDKTNTASANTKNESFLGFDGGTIDSTTLQNSTAKKVVATKIDSDLRYTILQGKIIDAVLETAINTNMASGVIRAVISRDVYAEHGDIILIPKGSRLVGSYGASSGSDAKKVMTRVYASWNRIITPHGIDINLPETPSTDQLGRAGVPGYLDTNLTNNLINAFLVSVLGPYIVSKASMSNDSSQTTSTIDPTTGKSIETKTSNSKDDIISAGITQFQSVATDQLNKVYPPGMTTIYIDQGTRIDIIAQEDIIFPKQAITQNAVNLP